MDSANGLADIQQELQAVKKALRENAVYLGMQGQTLQRYLLQLNEKENLLLSKQLRHMNADSSEPLAMGTTLPDIASTSAANGVATGSQHEAGPPAAPAPPPDVIAPFNRDNLDSVLSHLKVYEALAAECAKGLRALSSLAYADAQKVGETAGAVDQILRILNFHSGENTVVMAAIRTLCNMAYNQSVALKRLSEPSVMGVFLQAMTTSSDLEVKASEAVARVVAASQVEEAGSAGANAGLPALFTAASCGKLAWQQVVPRLIAQLVVNEVIVIEPVASAFVLAGRQCSNPNAQGWLFLAKLLSAPESPSAELPQALVDNGAIGAAAGLMERFVENGAAQLAGIEALSSLVGSRWSGLVAFAEVGGMLRIEAAMEQHPGNQVLQTKGVRALASGVAWPEDIQNKARYSQVRAINLTKAAMTAHDSSAELQSAALEGLSKYLEKGRHVEEVCERGGAGLVKAVMARNAKEPKVVQNGRTVLGLIGEDPHWEPRARDGAADQ